MSDENGHWTVDEITRAIGEIANDSDSKDRLRALGMLSRLNSGGATVPPPLTDIEIVERLTRLMLAAGEQNCRKAYHKAFGGSTNPERLVIPKEEMEQEIEVEVRKISGLKTYYRMFPDIAPVRGGFPQGYPHSSGPEEQITWLRGKATKILRDRKRQEIINARIAAENRRDGVADDPQADPS
jgi:hypothetical protein